ncbi:MAG: tRNA pseudouridine(55) synthase TruB [Christensenellales bacterium]
MNCIVNIYKPLGISSSDVVIKCRKAMSKALGYKVKCGHMGTLDPLAEGVLVLGFGKATRLFDYMQIKTKRYVATVTFGKTTDTLDREGEVVATSALPRCEQIASAVEAFRGEITQIPPAYSAISVDGVRAYELARQGSEVELPSRQVTIYDIRVLDIEREGEYCRSVEISVECSSGTYIRSLARDIADRLGVVGYMSSLKRTASGRYSIEDSVSLDDFIANPCEYVEPLLTTLSRTIPTYEIPPSKRKQVLNGVPCALQDIADGYVLLTLDGGLYSLAYTQDGVTKSKVNLCQDN